MYMYMFMYMLAPVWPYPAVYIAFAPEVGTRTRNL